MKLSIVIPCYNESKNIPLILNRFNEVINRDDIEIIMVNNGSTDNSQIVMENLISYYSFARIIKVEINQGYGFGIISGLKSAVGDFLSWTHADMQTDPSDVIKALELIEKSNNPTKTYIKGKRYGRPMIDVFFTLGMSIFETLYLKTPLNDINAQPNLFHRSFFELWNDPPHDFSLDLYALYTARRQGYEIVRFPVLFTQRIHGHSHWNYSIKSKWKFIKRTLDYSFELKKRI